MHRAPTQTIAGLVRTGGYVEVREDLFDKSIFRAGALPRRAGKSDT